MTAAFQRKVALLCGGPSAEYVVSLTSARCVAHALDRHRYRVRVFCIQEDGNWVCPEDEWTAATYPSRIEKLFDLLDNPEYCPSGFFKIRTPGEGLRRLCEWEPHVALPIMHGAFGEDGRIQGLLDFLCIPYAGSGVLASALAMDKRRTSSFLGAHGVRVPRHMVLRAGAPRAHRDDQLDGAGEMLGWPLIVKPCHCGSSIATTIARSPEELYRGATRAFEVDDEVLLEEFIPGTEVTCAVFDMAESYGGRLVCPPTEIHPTSGTLFDFDNKYRPGGAEEITPARLPEPVLHRIQTLAEKAHDLLGCFGMSRTDMIVPEDGVPVFLELNTIPGMTSTSLLPQGAAELGISMSAMLTGLIEGVFESIIERTAREGG